MPIVVASIDHVVLTVADIAATEDFYSRALGMRVEIVEGQHALHFGGQKFNLHQAGREFEPKARKPAAGSADFCLIIDTRLADAVAHLKREGIAIEVGPVERTGAIGPIRSIYLRDPDGNLVELANPM